MRKVFIFAILSLFLIGALGRCAEALSPSDIFRRYAPSVATLIVTDKEGLQKQGTAFLVSGRGELLTNYHVLAGADSVAVHFSEELWFSAKKIVAQDPQKDLALLWVESMPAIAHLGFSHIRLSEGDDLVVIGTPRGFDKTITTGILSGYRSYGGAELIQITAPISGGSSGSPVFGMDGKVIGIVIGTIRDSQGLNFAVGVKDIQEFLRTRPFKAPTASDGAQGRDQRLVSNRPVPAKASPSGFSEIRAKLALAPLGAGIASVIKNLGEPGRVEERGKNFRVSMWKFGSEGSGLFVWTRDDTVNRVEWMEVYAEKDEAESRRKSAFEEARAQFGNPTGTSRSGNSWKRSGHTFDIEVHDAGSGHVVKFQVKPKP